MIQDALNKAYLNWPIGSNPAARKQRSLYQYFVDRQVVITGRPGEIEAVIEKVNAAIKQANLAKPAGKNPWLPISGAQPAVLKMAVMLPPEKIRQDARLEGLREVEIRLYSLGEEGGQLEAQDPDLAEDENEAQVWFVVRCVHEEAAKLGLIVLADPNLVVANPGSGGAGGVSGGPIGEPVKAEKASPNQAAVDLWANRYWNQWAFQRPDTINGSHVHGINLEKRRTSFDNPDRRFIADTGGEVRVFVLDTADSELLGGAEVVPPGKNEALPISIFSVRKSVAFDTTAEEASASPVDISGHGRFVCGLLNRVAPEAKINLWQVLDDQGRGEIFTLTCALLLVAAYGLEKPCPGGPLPLSDVVVNLSLTANLSEDRILKSGVRKAIDDLWEKMSPVETGSTASAKKYGSNHILFRLLDDMFRQFYYGPSLRIPVILLNSQGAVIAAAAGNESADRYANMPALVPARYPEVIGVGSSNMGGGVSSFSNLANVYAPGGGHPDPEYPIIDLKRLLKKDGQDLEPLAIYGLVPSNVSLNGLAYWWGTSFSTPLVAGLAALVMQKHRSKYQCGAEPDKVREKILSHAKNKIIDVEATMQAVEKA